jgi:arylsulfatase A-like enzyme
MTRPNVLLISIDTLRADHLSCYGYARATTPGLDRLAAEGTRYERCSSTAVWTPPAHGSMLTGLYPTQHGVVDENKLDESIPTIATTLREAGYRTFGAVNNSQVGALTALHRGHETFHEVWRGRRRPWPIRAARYLRRKLGDLRGVNDHGARRTNDLVQAWLSAHDRRAAPFYVFLHYIEPHNPLCAPRPFRHRYVDPRRTAIDRAKVALVADNPLVCFTDDLQLTEDELEFVKALYDGEVSYVDARIGELLDFLRRAGLYDDTLVIVTADHGEHFGEHGLYSHVSSLYQPIVHVPLIVKFPGGAGPAGVRRELVQHVDILPTIAELCGATPAHAAKLRGRSLANHGASGHEFVYAEWEGRVPYFVKNRLRGRSSAVCQGFLLPMSMIRDTRYKYVLRQDGAAALYDLEQDPGERDNLADKQPDVAARMKGRLTEWLEGVGQDRPRSTRYDLDPEVEKHLQGLGYL